MRNKNAFTLIELIISISLILLLFTIVVPGITKLIQQSKVKQCEQIKENVLTSVDLYVTENKNTFNAGGIITLSQLYAGNYIDEEYKIDINNSTIEKGKWKQSNGSETDINISINKNEISTGSGYGYFTYTIETDFCN